MYCSNCGKQISDQANFCNYCGSKVNVVRHQGGSSAPRQPQQSYTPPVQATPAKKERNWGKRIMSLVMVVLVYFGARYATEAFLTRDLRKEEPTTTSTGTLLNTAPEVSLTDSCFYGALYENDYVTYGLAKMYLPGYFLLPGEGDERDWLMSEDETVLFSATKQLEILEVSFSATSEESVLSTSSEDGSAASMVDFQKIYVGGFPVVRYIVHYTDAEMEQFIGELIIFPGETTTETLRVSMYELAEYGYDEINRAFDTLTISAENALTADDTQVIGLNRITVK